MGLWGGEGDRMTGSGERGSWSADGQPIIRRAAGASSGPSDEAAVDVDRPKLGPLLVWWSTLATTTGLLFALGRTPLASPPLTQLPDWLAWAQMAAVDQVIFNVLRILGLALSGYLLGVTTVGAVARLLSWAGLVRLADALTARPVRLLLQQALGVTLAVTTVAGLPGTPLRGTPVRAAPPVAEAAAGSGPPADSIVVPQVRAEASLRARSGTSGHDSWGEVGQHVGASLWVAAPPVEADVPPVEPGGPRVEADARPIETGDRTVAAGDHFWSLAREVVGVEASDADVAIYWRRLIEVNRDRLVDASNPDLLLPGQVLVVPPVAA